MLQLKPSVIVELGKELLISFILISIISITYFFNKQISNSDLVQSIMNNLNLIDYISYEKADFVQQNIGICFSILITFIFFLYFIKVIYKYLYIKTTKYKIDFENNFIIIEEGIFSRNKDSFNMNMIMDIDTNQNFLEMITKTVDVIIYTQGDLSSSNKGLSQKEKENIANINNSIEFGYVGVKKLKSIKNSQEIFEKIVSKIKR